MDRFENTPDRKRKKKKGLALPIPPKRSGQKEEGKTKKRINKMKEKQVRFLPFTPSGRWEWR